MRRRRGSGPVISLFSFQDIITSVTAIILVMVLLLSLELIERSEASPQHIAADTLTQLKQALVASRAELEPLRELTQTVDQVVRQAAESTPSEISEENAARRRRIQELQKTVEQLSNRAGKLSRQEAAAEARRFDAKPKVDELASVNEQVADLTKKVERLTADGRPVYALPRGSQMDGWLAVVETGLITAAPLGKSAVPAEFRDRRVGILSSESAAAQFVSHVQKTASRPYVLLLVRPAGVESFDKIESLLTTRRIQFGFDLISPEETILDPQHGAWFE